MDCKFCLSPLTYEQNGNVIKCTGCSREWHLKSGLALKYKRPTFQEQKGFKKEMEIPI